MQQRPGRLQLRHDKGILIGHVGEGRAGGGGRAARDVDVVLDREGHAPQRQRRIEGPSASAAARTSSCGAA